MALVWGAFLGVIREVWDGRLSPTGDSLTKAEECVWEAIRR